MTEETTRKPSNWTVFQLMVLAGLEDEPGIDPTDGSPAWVVVGSFVASSRKAAYVQAVSKLGAEAAADGVTLAAVLTSDWNPQPVSVKPRDPEIVVG